MRYIRMLLTRLLTWLFAGYMLLAAWLGVLIIWLIVPLFLVANGCIFLAAIEMRPLWAMATLVSGWAIGLFLLWASYQFLKIARAACRSMISELPDKEKLLSR